MRDNSERRISYDKTNLKTYKAMKPGDFIIHLRSFEGGLECSNHHGISSPAYRVLRTEKLIPLAFKDYFRSYNFIEGKLSIAVTGIRDGKSIDMPSFWDIKISYPHFSEQERIAHFLSVLDMRIHKQQQLVEYLKLYKKGVLNKLFSNFDNMEEYTLGELCNITTGKLDANAMKENGVYRFYTCAKEFYWINTYAFDTDALLISGNGANVGYIHHYCGKFNAYQRTYVLDNFNTSNITYIKYYLEAKLKERIESEKKAGNTPYIVLSTLSEMPIYLPKAECQTQIATLLTNYDELITNQENTLSALSGIKRGLLQQMFI